MQTKYSYKGGMKMAILMVLAQIVASQVLNYKELYGSYHIVVNEK